MPIYEYRCENGHHFDVMQRMADDPVTTCEECGAPVQRVLQPVAVHFKGKGFYNTDYGTKKRQRELSNSAESGADARDAGQKEKKSDGASSSDSSSSTSSSSSSDGGGSGASGGSGGSSEPAKPKKDSATTS